MRKETNLKRVKEIAHLLLMTDIQKTEFSPIIVKHPFTDTGVTTVPNDEIGFQVVNIMDDENAQRQWRESVGKIIDEAENAYEIYMRVTKPYGLTFLKFVSLHLSRTEMSEILADAWVRSEAPNQDVNVSQVKLLSMFKKADVTILMEQDEYEQFQALDDIVTVYRGVTPYNADSIRALSWTLNQETAEWFAHRFGEDGTVYEAQIPKVHIYALMNRRNEMEVIVNPNYLTDITEVQDMNNEIAMTM